MAPKRDYLSTMRTRRLLMDGIKPGRWVRVRNPLMYGRVITCTKKKVTIALLAGDYPHQAGFTGEDRVCLRRDCAVVCPPANWSLLA